MQRISFLIFLVLGTPALAGDFCDDVWFSRNLMYDRSSYCFESNLGKAVFDNSDCSPLGGILTKMDRDFVDWMDQLAKDYHCDVDTTRTTLDVDLIDVRRLISPPVGPEGFEGDCIDWKGPDIELRQMANLTSPISGQVQQGDNIFWEYKALYTPDGWWFFTVRREGEVAALGWSDYEFDADLCTAFAG